MWTMFCPSDDNTTLNSLSQEPWIVQLATFERGLDSWFVVTDVVHM